MDDLRQRLAAIVKDLSGLTVADDTVLAGVLTSVQVLELVVRLEEQLAVSLESSELDFETFGDLHDVVSRRCA